MTRHPSMRSDEGASALSRLAAPSVVRAKAAARQMRRADILIDRGRLSDALEACRRALDEDPGRADIYAKIGALAGVLKQPQTSRDALEIAATLDPHDPTVLCNLGAALRELGHPREAVDRLQASLRLDAAQPSGWYNLAVALSDQARWQDAVACYRRALQGAPRHGKAAAGMASALLSLGEIGAAIDVARQALAAAPDIAELHIALADALLAAGQLAEGWREYEWRWRVPDMAAAHRHAGLKLWQGQPLQGRTLLVHAEQGFGDLLQMCRYIPLIAGAGHIILEVPRSLTRLLATLPSSPGIGRTIAAIGADLPPADLQCPIMSLPAACGTKRPADVPAAIPYLHPDPEDVARWQDRLAGVTGPRIGLCWNSGGRPDLISRIMQARKSIQPALLAPLAAVPGCRFVSLQIGQHPVDLPPGLPLIDYAPLVRDFADTAALIATLDLVITVDTAVAHLSGAIGAPTWVLNRADADWRWSRTALPSPWYPAMRQFRQERQGDWGGVITAVTAALEHYQPDPTRLQHGADAAG
jgi:tetratricopeptide (TPR) repeat protein